MIIWAGVTASNVIGPYFFDGTVSGGSYFDILWNYVIPDPGNRGQVTYAVSTR